MTDTIGQNHRPEKNFSKNHGNIGSRDQRACWKNHPIWFRFLSVAIRFFNEIA
jgi:hypothetical protein